MLPELHNAIKNYIHKPDESGASPYFVGQVLHDIDNAKTLDDVASIIDAYSGGTVVLDDLYPTIYEYLFDNWLGYGYATSGILAGSGETFWYSDGWDTINKMTAIIEQYPGAKEYWKERGYDPDEFGFSDEYTTCSDCGKIIRTSPDCYQWEPDYIITDGEILCCECVKSEGESLLDEYINNTHKALPDILESAAKESGWFKLPIEYENGWHPGQDDDPKKIAAPLIDAGIDFLYWYDNSQFYITFGLYVLAENVKQAADILHVEYTFFDDYGNFIGALPKDCIAQCSAPGPVDDAVDYWRIVLGFRPPRYLAIPYLLSTGAWDETELNQSDDIVIAQRVLWLACCDIKEGGEFLGLQR